MFVWHISLDKACVWPISSLPHRKNVPEYAVSREKNDLGALRFDMTSDLTPLFNWNTKQLFLYLVAEYETQNNKVNQVSVGQVKEE